MSKMILRFVLWFGLGLAIAIVSYLLSLIPRDIVSYLVYLRLPLMAGILLILFPIISIKVSAIAPLFRNLFVMSKKSQVTLGVFAAIVAGRAIAVVTNAIITNSPDRFGVAPIPNFSFSWDYLVTILLGITTIWGIFSETRIERQWWEEDQALKVAGRAKYAAEIVEARDLYSGVAIGILAGIGMIGAELIVMQGLIILAPILTTLVNFIFPFWGFLNIDGYIDKSTQIISQTHLQGLAFLIVGSCIYWIVRYYFRPQIEQNRDRLSPADSEAPVLIYVSALFALIVTGFGGITFYFDKFGFPIFLGLLVFSGVSYLIWGVDHFFDLFEDREPTQLSTTQSEVAIAMEERLKHQGAERTLVVVTASGGGIHAAGWTTQVLTGLQNFLGENFTRSIGLISSVSGGSVGSMYFLDEFADQGFPANNIDTLDGIVKNAVQDGLDAVGWGLVYRDFWRFIGLPWAINKNEDRATALETNWQNLINPPKRNEGQNPNYPYKTLSYWRKQIFNGVIPIPVFNTTLVEAGQRLLVSPLTFSPNEDDQTIDSNTLYQNNGKPYDLTIVTAARLSATFPYVSPSPRNPEKAGINRNYHIIDGGYFDNSGVVTAIEWLDKNQDILLKELNVKRLVLIEIEAGEANKQPEKFKGDGGWLMTLFGPILALLTVRDGSLIFRNRQSIDLLLQDYRSHLDKNSESEVNSNVQYVRIDFPKKSRSRDKNYSQPLSWKLTASQKYVLAEAWEDLIQEAIPQDTPQTLANLKRRWDDWKVAR